MRPLGRGHVGVGLALGVFTDGYPTRVTGGTYRLCPNGQNAGLSLLLDQIRQSIKGAFAVRGNGGD